jgi:uncharacterized coiled-coil protein SlyX
MADEPHHYPRAATESPEQRMTRLEMDTARVNMRLENGQKEFMALREEQRALRGQIEQLGRDLAPKPLTRFQLFGFVAGPVLGLVLILGGIIWQAARYPDRAEVGLTTREMERRIGELEQKLGEQGRDVAALNGASERHEKTLEKVDAKIERLLTTTTKGK